MELVHPIWHKTHFKIKWIYIGLMLDLVLIIIFYGTKNALITKVKLFFSQIEVHVKGKWFKFSNSISI